MNSYYDQKEYIGRSVHYWKVVMPLLEKIKNRRSIPEPLDPLFIHFTSKDIQVNIKRTTLVLLELRIEQMLAY